ncbi:MAG: hypothetical protein RMY34_12795 [Aulosira sp. DedQUE10]|nr:hypothetical protein [Aulosira sp. DedQUE10]
MANLPQLDSTSEVLSQYDLLKLVVTGTGGATRTKPAFAGCGLIKTVLSCEQLRLLLLELPLGLSCFEVSK